MCVSGGGTKLDVGGTVALSNLALDINAKGTLPFSLAARALADAGLRLDGSAALDASVTGPASKPDINGTVSTRGARFIELSSGLVLDDLSGTIRLAGQEAKLQDIRGRLGKEGLLTINGTVGIDPASQMPADIRLALSKASFQYEDILTTLFDADLNLKGQLAGSSVLAGTINLTNSEIFIPEGVAESLSPLAVRHKNATGKVAEQAEKFTPRETSTSAGDGPAIALDLAINSPRRIFVRGRGMDAELGGTIRVEGTTANPRPIGSVAMQRGRMDLLTKRLDFDTGAVTFAGTLDPALDFSASSTQSGTTFTLAVGGYASAPEIALSSSPAMPEDEILANLFFDRNLADLSPIQLAQLANAVATLSGVNSGPGLLDRLRGLAGIDNIDVKSDEKTGETTVGAGSYLNERTYVNVEKATNSDSGKVTIDLELTDQFKMRGEADSQGNSKAGIFFERDY